MNCAGIMPGHEQWVIGQVWNCLESLADRCSKDRRLDTRSSFKIIEFLRNFASGVGPISVMRGEHDQGCARIGGIEQATNGAAAGTADAREADSHRARHYFDLLRAHTQKRNYCLPPVADVTLTAEEQRQLERSLDQVERENLVASVNVRCVRLADNCSGRSMIFSLRLAVQDAR